jgi:sugar phosphate isomerase/epimerase
MWSFEKLHQKGEMSVEQFLEYASANRYDAVELLDYFWRKEKGEVEQARSLADGLGMPIGAYAIGNDFAHADAQARKQAAASVKRGVDNAVRLGAPLVRIFGGSPKPGVDYEHFKSWLLESLGECVEYAGENNINLAMENHGLLSGKSAQVLEIIRAVNSPFFGATADLGNFLLVDEDPLQAVKALAPHVLHVHCKDMMLVEPNDSGPAWTSLAGKRYRGTILGRGAVGISRALEFLRSANYRGCVSIEFEGEEETYAALKESEEYVSRSLRGHE